MSDSKNDIAWGKLFEKHNINEKIKENGHFIISSSSINEFREARLMTKFDHTYQQPNIFLDNKISILPISRGEYLLSNIQTFKMFDKNDDLSISDMLMPYEIESLDFSTITSEAIAINCAYISNILSNFIEDERLDSTVNGRMSSQTFDFEINRFSGYGETLKVSVQNAQIEIDGGYESERFLSLIEAKNSLSTDFLIRQLYYPYRLWESKINKKVYPIFLTYTNGVFHLRRYEFESLHCYNSINLVNEKKYRLINKSEDVINIEVVYKISQNVTFIDEPRNVPFPQADSFDRIINFCEILYNNTDEPYTKEALGLSYDFKEKASFDKRQIDYYTNAAIYLGLVDKVGTAFELSSFGMKLFQMNNIIERQIEFIKRILSFKVFNEVFRLWLEHTYPPTKDVVIAKMKMSNLNNIYSDSTFSRRSSTVLSWVGWIFSSMNE